MKAPSSGNPAAPVPLVLVVALVLLAGACASPDVTPSASATSPRPSPAAPSQPTATPSPTTPSSAATPPPAPSVQSSCAQQVLNRMTVAQRIGQLFSLGLADNRLGAAELGAIQNQHVGSFWFTAVTSVGVSGVRAVADTVQAQATSAATAGVRFFVSANQEGGQIQALNGPGFSPIPAAVAQGGRSITSLTTSATKWGQQLLAAGVNLDFAPVADVVPPGTDATNQPIGVLQREYGHDPQTAGSHAAAFIRGLTAAGVATTAKHFPGLGRVASNTDFSAGVIDNVTTATDPYLASFRATIDAGVPFVMVALATYTRIDPDHLAAFSSVVIGGVLRKDLGFQGVVMSDSLTAEAVSAIPPGQRAVDFLLAGGDLVVVHSAAATVAMVAAVQARAASDAGFAARVNDAALRILKAKQSAALLPPGC